MGGDTFTARTAAIEAAKKGKFMYGNQALLIDDTVDPRLKRPLDPLFSLLARLRCRVKGATAPAPVAVNLAAEVAKAAGAAAARLLRPNEPTGTANKAARINPVAGTAHTVVAPDRDTHHIGPHIKPCCSRLAQCGRPPCQRVTYEQDFHSTTASGTGKEFV